MAASIHFVLLVGVALGAIALVLWCRSPDVRRRVALGLLLGAVLAGAGLTSGLHLCSMGQPLTQWAVPAIATSAVWVGSVRPRWAAGFTLVCALVAVGLSLDYAARVHTDAYVGAAIATDEPEPVQGRFAWHTAVTGLYERDHALPEQRP